MGINLSAQVWKEEHSRGPKTVTERITICRNPFPKLLNNQSRIDNPVYRRLSLPIVRIVLLAPETTPLTLGHQFVLAGAGKIVVLLSDFDTFPLSGKFNTCIVLSILIVEIVDASLPTTHFELLKPPKFWAIIESRKIVDAGKKFWSHIRFPIFAQISFLCLARRNSR
ncbi:hypothetical protein CDAR_609431 [Caerostris darwini]|uniref:Uncharacterized protein n=1 Tax=Caerostris darwini TaxID=1538125 RepID=A0AAV4VZY4_9ARAC|nr:hypothetical protein CDAR_609431 [Caerostris darwini]